MAILLWKVLRFVKLNETKTLFGTADPLNHPLAKISWLLGAKWLPLRSSPLPPAHPLAWPWRADLEEHFDQRLEYSYPSIKQTADGKIHITYTWSLTRRRVAIRYMQVTEGWIRGAWDWGTTRGWYQPSAAA